MPRVCTVCTHPDRLEIDAALVARVDSNRRIAARYGVSENAIRRHKAEHLPEALVKATEAGELASAEDLLCQAQAMHTRALKILEKAEEAGDLRTALQAIREGRGCLELHARMVAAALELEREHRPVTVEDIDREIARLEAELETRERRGEIPARTFQEMTDEELDAEMIRTVEEMGYTVTKNQSFRGGPD